MAHLLFLSHAGADTERALRLAAAIEASPEAQKHGLKVWLDKRPDGPHRLQAGTPWQDQLERAIATQSTAFGLLLTREGARNWVRLEVRVALDRVIAEQRGGATYPFVPIIADDPGDLAHLPPFAQQYQGVRLTGDGSGLADLVRTAARLDAAQPVRLVAQPFMGLEAFEAKDAALFFGRRKETQDLVDRLRTTNLILVTGDSGSGKSSLVKAGLIPAFREGALADPLGRRPEPGQWHVVEMRPGTDPFEGLVEGTQRAATAAGIAPDMIFALGTAIRTRDPGSIRDALRQSGPPGASLLLAVDQFEELWTLTIDDSKRRDFLAALLALVPEGALDRRVVGTMRRDYYHLHTDDERLRDRLAANGNAGRFLLGAMVPESLRDIVERPLLLAGESEARAAALADEVVKDVAGEPGNLALVEMALYESWERRHESGGDLALAYQRLDRLEGALARAAEEVFWNPSDDPRKLIQPERPIAEALFIRLVRVGDAGSATRRPVSFAELEDTAKAVARKLATLECRRLLVLNEPDGRSRGGDAITAELAHEQLATQWPDYRFWVRGTRTSRHEAEPSRVADKQALDRLIDTVPNWNRRGRREVDLARGGLLEDFKRLRCSSVRNAWLSQLERTFVDQSITASEAADREQQRQIQTLRRQRFGGALLIMGMLFALGLFGWQWRAAIMAKIEAHNQAIIAEKNARAADEQLTAAKRNQFLRLVNLSLQLTEAGDAVTGTLVALHAFEKRPGDLERPVLDELWPVLRKSLAERRELFDLPHDGQVDSAAISSDKRKVVTVSFAGVATLWTLDNDRAPVVLGDHDRRISSAKFSPDGNLVATASSDGTVQVWQAVGGGKPLVLRGHQGPVLDARFDAEGAKIVSASDDHTARVWHSDGSSDPIVLRGHGDGVVTASFSPDGARVITASADETARIWTVDGSREPTVLRGHGGVVVSASFSHDGTHVITTSTDNTARVWRTDGKGEPLVLSGLKNLNWYAAFDRSGTRVVLIAADGTAQIWRIDGIGGPSIFGSSDDKIISAAFSPDGNELITATEDGTVKIWRTDVRRDPIALRGHTGPIISAEFSPDGELVATASRDGTARIWRTGERRDAIILDAYPGPISSAVFSPDGTQVLTASKGTTVRIWDAQSSAPLDTLSERDGYIHSATFSPDGSPVMVTSDDSTAWIWRAGKKPIRTPVHWHNQQILSATLSRDESSIAAIFSDYTALVWQLDGSQEAIALDGHDKGAIYAAFSQDGSQVVTAGIDGNTRIWSLASKQLLATLRGHVLPVSTAAFSFDGSLVVTGSVDETARVWRADGRGDAIVLRGHEGAVVSSAFSRDGTRIVTASEDGTVRVWRSDGSGTPLVLGDRRGEARLVEFSPSGESVLAGYKDGTARIWLLTQTLDQLVDNARASRLPRQLTEDQKKKYFIIDDW